MIKKSFLILFCGLVVVSGINLYNTFKEKTLEEIHIYHLNNSPFKASENLNRKERLARGLPPNKFNEQMFDLTLDPSTGVPNYESKEIIQKRLEVERTSGVDKFAVPGQSGATPWYEIGPKNAAGRSRAAIWDLTDGSGTRVIAGGVSGGLWKNEDVSDPNSAWTRITGVPGNLAISVIVQDPNNTSVMYAGTGESYTNGDASGNGIYKSINGGVDWDLVFGRGQSTNVTTTFSGVYTQVQGFFAINDIVLYDHDNSNLTDAQVFAAVGTTWFSRANNNSDSNPMLTGLDTSEYGLWKSDDAGSTFNKISLPEGNVDLNDLEVQEVSNRIWISSTKNQYWGSQYGGRFYYSDDGTTFVRVVPNFPAFPNTSFDKLGRTEIASSRTVTDTHYIIVVNSDHNSSTLEYPNIPVIYKTTDNFANLTYIEPPKDADLGIPDFDFTRGQSFYDLEIEVDPDDPNIIYVGGIDWFRSQDGGDSWSQITKWATWNPNLNDLNVSTVHADQHGLYFKPGDSNKAIVVNDGGVYYSSNLSTASNSLTFTGSEKDMITLQFYTATQSPPDFAGNDYAIGGTQDNGTWSVQNSNLNKTDGAEVQGGDGAATEFDQVGGHYFISNYTYNNTIKRTQFDASGTQSGPAAELFGVIDIPDNEGDFINPGTLDSNQDVYFSCGGMGKIRVITGLERGGTPATFLITGIDSGNSHATTLKVSPYTTDSSTLFVGTSSGKILKITNANNSGTYAISEIYDQAGSVSDIHFGATEDEIYLTYFNYGLNSGTNSNIRYINTGFGTSFSKEGDLPDLPVLSILHNPYVSNEVIVGTELGVWRTTNFNDVNPNWVQSYNGMSDVPVRDMDFRGTSALDNRVIAASYGRGLYVGSFEADTNPPISTTDSITVIEGGTATTTTGGATSVLSNDSDPDGDTIQTDLVSTTINGILSLSPSGTGSFTYTHNDTETTTDTFWYRAYDGAIYGNTVSVTINITPVNECPNVQNPLSNITVPEDSTQEQIPITNVFDDPEGSTLSYTVTNTNPSLLNASIASTLGFPVTHTLLLDYQADATGTATITIFANDSGCGALIPHEFLVTVNPDNDLPVGISDTVTVTEGGTVTVTSAGATSVLFNDTDLENHTLTVGIGNGAIAPSVSKGSINLLNNGSFTYTHNGNQNPGDVFTTDSFLYSPFDIGAGPDADFGNTTTVTIQILHTNDCPIENIPINDFNAMEDDPDLEIDISSVFSDEENDAITLTVSSTNLALLSATKSSATTLTIDYVDNMTGSSTIILYATDNTAECSTLVSSTFVISVEPENDTPVGVPDTITVFEGSSVSTTTAGNSVLVNDTDTEGDNLTVIKLTDPLWHKEGGANFTLQASGTFIYNHDSSETTTDSFTYRLTDSFTTTDVLVTINIIPVNDCPEVSVPPLPDITVNEDAADTVINLSSYFSDAENNPLSYSFTNADNSSANVILNTNTLTIQYIPEQSGTTTVTISVDDSTCTVQEIFLVNITAVNDPPLTVTDTLFVLERGTVTQTTLSNTSLLTNDTDTESDALEAIQLTAPVNGTLAFSSTGTFTYTHDGSETTTDSFQYRAAEIAPGGQFGNIITVSITIQEVNDCPVYTAVGGFPDADEDGPTWTWNYGAEISDPDGNAPLYTLTHTATSLLTATTDANGIVTFTPKLNQFGTTTMTLNVNDRRSCDIDIEIPVTINPINDCPTLENPTPDISANEDDPDLIIPLANIFEDVDTTPLIYSTTIGNNSLVATSITATALIIDFLPNQSGSTFINLVAFDGDINCTEDDLFTISVLPVNDPPTGIADFVNLVRGATTSVLNDGVTTSVLANDSDPEGDAITAALVTGPINGTVNLSANGNFTYTHDNSATVTDSFTYTPRDIFTNIGNTTTVTIYINNAPVGVTETIALFEGGTATTTTAASTSVLSNDTDADAGDAALLTAIIGTSPLYGTLALNADGSFTYTHSGSEDLTDSFTYIPFDGKGYGLPTVVSVTISPTNDAPVAFPDSITVGIGQTTSLLTGGMNSVLANDTDADGDTLTAILVSGTSSGTLVLNPGGTFSYTQNGVMDAGDSFTYMARDSSDVDSNVVTVNISLTCSPCTEKTIEAGSSGVIVSYRGCDCRKYDLYVPKGKVFIFCHLDGSVSIDQGSYTVLSSKVCY